VIVTGQWARLHGVAVVLVRATFNRAKISPPPSWQISVGGASFRSQSESATGELTLNHSILGVPTHVPNAALKYGLQHFLSWTGRKWISAAGEVCVGAVVLWITFV
jgi:hypothetical protein